MTAMDMRMFDSAIARWVVQDPVVHHFQSPYNGFDGNPVYWADPSGADVVETKDAYIFGGDDVKGVFSALINGTSYTTTGNYNYSDLEMVQDYNGNGGGAGIIGSLVYTLLNDTKNIHQVSFTQSVYMKVRIVNVGIVGVKTLIDFINVSTSIEIKMVNNELIFNTTQVTTYGITMLGGESILNECSECYTKTNTTSNSGLSMSDIANRAANFIGNQLKVNPEYNLFNQPNSYMKPGIGTGIALLMDKYKILKRGNPLLYALDLAEGYDLVYKKYNNYSGSQAIFNVYSDGTLKLQSYDNR